MDFGDTLGEFDELEKIQMEQSREEHLYQVKDKLARMNYDSIEKNGIDYYSLEKSTVGNIVSSLSEMINHFEGTEEYEKCLVLKNHLDKIFETF